MKQIKLEIGASLIAQLVKNPPAMQEIPVWFLGWVDLLEKGSATHSSILGRPCGSAGKESACKVGDLGLIPGLGRSLEKEKVTHSSILAWRIPWTVQSTGSQKVGHDWATFTHSLKLEINVSPEKKQDIIWLDSLIFGFENCRAGEVIPPSGSLCPMSWQPI